MVLSVVVDLTL
jgi:hypothetical protein